MRRAMSTRPTVTGTGPMLVISIAIAVGSGCYAVRFSHGGGEAEFEGAREVRAGAVAVPAGYRIEPLVQGLSFPTGVAFDAEGRPCILESGYSYGEVFTTPRLLRLESDGRLTTIARGETRAVEGTTPPNNGPWTGVAFDGGEFFVAEGGVRDGGKILRIASDGTIRPLIENLPSRGDHHTNGPAIGPDGKVYFGIGTATNAGVVGEDNAQFGWLARAPGFHDIPGADVVLKGKNFETSNALGEGTTETGAYVPYGTKTSKGQVIRGETICTGSVLRIARDGGEPELVAWGFRNPFGLAFAPDGSLLVTDNGFDERGSRSIWGAADVLWKVEAGRWYGWPDYSAGQPVTREDFDPPGGGEPELLLAEPPGTPPAPLASFACHSSADGLDVSRNAAFGFEGDAFVALFGDQVPATGKLLAPVGFKVVRVELESGAIEDFATNRGDANGPASLIGGGGLERPVAVRFDPSGSALYVVDFGVLLQAGKQTKPQPGTGVLWRVTREGARTAEARR